MCLIYGCNESNIHVGFGSEVILGGGGDISG